LSQAFVVVVWWESESDGLLVIGGNFKGGQTYVPPLINQDRHSVPRPLPI
jgi:hypothetical protein